MKPLPQIARTLGCTPEQVRAQLARNGAGLARMADKAQRTGRPVNHYDARTLRGLAARYLNASKST